MTLAEKRKYVTGCCADMEDCDSCPCYAIDTCYNGAILCLYDEKRLDDMIDEFQKTIPPDKEVEQELHECEDYDTVSKPKHYASTSIECIDAMTETQGVEAVKSFCVCNAFKYLWRHNGKNGDEDIRKASWYLNKAVELIERGST